MKEPFFRLMIGDADTPECLEQKKYGLSPSRLVFLFKLGPMRIWALRDHEPLFSERHGYIVPWRFGRYAVFRKWAWTLFVLLLAACDKGVPTAQTMEAKPKQDEWEEPFPETFNNCVHRISELNGCVPLASFPHCEEITLRHCKKKEEAFLKGQR